jgi:HK97 family phage major capsid protein
VTPSRPPCSFAAGTLPAYIGARERRDRIREALNALIAQTDSDAAACGRASEARALRTSRQPQIDALTAEVDQAEEEVRRAEGLPAWDRALDTRAANHRAAGYDTYALGAPDPGRAELRAGEHLTDWARRSRLIPADHERTPLSLGKYLKGMVTGQWQDADAERRVMSEGTLTAGGYAVPTVLSSQIIDKARNATRVLQAGGRVVPMANATVDIARWEGDPSGSWRNESALISATDAVLGRVRLTARSFATLTRASLELLQDADPMSIEQELRRAFGADLALKLDLAALYGSGTAPEPRGVKNQAGVTTRRRRPPPRARVSATSRRG